MMKEIRNNVNGCTINHYQMLHQDEKQSGSIHNTNVPASQIILSAGANYGSDCYQYTFAYLCYEASTTTLIDVIFAEQFFADGPKLPFCCR
jgi:hypothetical protein